MAKLFSKTDVEYIDLPAGKRVVSVQVEQVSGVETVVVDVEDIPREVKTLGGVVISREG